MVQMSVHSYVCLSPGKLKFNRSLNFPFFNFPFLLCFTNWNHLLHWCSVLVCLSLVFFLCNILSRVNLTVWRQSKSSSRSNVHIQMCNNFWILSTLWRPNSTWSCVRRSMGRKWEIKNYCYFRFRDPYLNLNFTK